MNPTDEPESSPAQPGWRPNLKLIAFIGLAGMIGATGQLVYWFYFDPDLPTSLTLKSIYIIITCPLSIFCIACGLARARRTFAIAALGASLLHIAATLHFNFIPTSELFQSLLAGRLDFWLKPAQTTWFYCWNVGCIAIHSWITYHLLRHELLRR